MTQKSSLKEEIARIYSLLDKEQYEQAFKLLAKIDISELSESSTEAGDFLYLTAFSLNRESKYQEAIPKAQKALDILKESNQNKKIVSVQILLGNIYRNIGDLEKAKTEYRDALKISKVIEDTGQLSVLHNKLAQICFMQSDFEKAVDYLRDGMRLARELGNIDRIAGLSENLSTIYRELGKWQLCEETLLLVLDVAERSNLKIKLMNCYLNLGRITFLQRRFAEAEDYYNEALELTTEVGDVFKSHVFYVYQGELCFVQGDWQTARKHYNKALEIGEKIAPESGIVNHACRLLSELELAEGNLDGALTFCVKALRVSLKLKNRSEEGMVCRLLGQIYFKKKDNPEAKENFEKSIKLLKDIKANYELGRAYLEAGRSGCFDYLERLELLRNAQSSFQEVETSYHVAHTYLAISKLLYENAELGKSFSLIQEAEKIFKRLDEKKEREKCSKLRLEIERKLTQLKDVKDIPSKFSFSNFITQNKEMLDIIHKAEQVKDKDITVLIQGETGTGKDLLVRMIHYNSNRADKKFVALNCANLPEALLESELFGHKKGAFTGANVDKKGLLEVVDEGTLFLNEIGELPLSVQAKLLSVLEEKQFTRLGDTEPRKVDVRIIAATNRNLEEAVENKTFREDLYYRLGVIRLNLPPLRERKEDIKLLISHFLEKHANGSRDKVLEASKRLNELFMSYPWPGNVRELENEIIKLSTLIEIKDQDGLNRLIEQVEKEKKLRLSDSLSQKREALEKAEIRNALRASNNVKSKAARILNIPEATLRRKLKKYDITL